MLKGSKLFIYRFLRRVLSIIFILFVLVFTPIGILLTEITLKMQPVLGTYLGLDIGILIGILIMALLMNLFDWGFKLAFKDPRIPKRVGEDIITNKWVNNVKCE